MRTGSRRSAAAFVTIIGAAVAGADPGVPPPRVIAMTGGSAEAFGLPGHTIASLSPATINQNGVVALGMRTRETGAAFDFPTILTWRDGAGTIAARQGDPLGHHSLLKISDLGTPIVSESGEMAFVARYLGSSNKAVLAGQPGALRLIAMSGPEVLFPGDWLTEVGNFDRVSFSRSGHLSFDAPGVFPPRRTYIGTSAGVSVAFEAGMPAPGLPAGTTMFNLGFTRIDDAGNAYALGQAQGGGFSGERVMASAGAAGPRLIAAPGLPVPGVPGASFVSSAGPMSVNGAGVIGLTENYSFSPPGGPYVSGAWVGSASDRRMIARVDGPAPGFPAGHTFRTLTSPLISHSGRAGMLAIAQSPSGYTYQGFWAGDPAEGLSLIVSTEDAVDNMPGWTLASVTATTGEAPVFNDRDQIAFLGNVWQSGLPSFNALLVAGPDRSLLAVAVVGQPFEVAPGVTKVVRDIDFFHSLGQGNAGDDGYGTSFNDRGDLVYWIRFTDLSHGVFVTTIPAPGGLVLLGLGLGQPRRARRS